MIGDWHPDKGEFNHLQIGQIMNEIYHPYETGTIITEK
jgi:hypothetical protein